MQVERRRNYRRGSIRRLVIPSSQPVATTTKPPPQQGVAARDRHEQALVGGQDITQPLAERVHDVLEALGLCGVGAPACVA